MITGTKLLLVLALTGVEGVPNSLGGTSGVLTMDASQAVAIYDVAVPAEEPSPIRQVLVREGEEVEAGQLVVQMKDEQPRLAKKAAEYKRNAADKQAKSEVEIQYARAQYLVANKEWLNAMEVNKQARNAVPEREVDRLKLAADRAQWSIKKAVQDREVAELTAQSEAAEVEAADLAINRRQIKSPIDGVVIEVVKQDGEWAAAGDTLLRIMRIDELRVKGYFYPEHYAPEWVADGEVTFSVKLAGGTEEFTGRVEYVSSALVNRKCVVWAVIKNRKRAGQWLLRDGSMGQMSIKLNGAPSDLGTGNVEPDTTPGGTNLLQGLLNGN